MKLVRLCERPEILTQTGYRYGTLSFDSKSKYVWQQVLCQSEGASACHNTRARDSLRNSITFSLERTQIQIEGLSGKPYPPATENVFRRKKMLSSNQQSVVRSESAGDAGTSVCTVYLRTEGQTPALKCCTLSSMLTNLIGFCCALGERKIQLLFVHSFSLFHK